MPLRPGETVGTYEVVRRVGGGASADVFEVVHITLGTRHALKVLQAQWVEDPDLRARFLAEGRLQAGFRSPHLVRVTDTLASPGIAALVMDFLEGETLRDRLDREGKVAPVEAVRFVREALEGLAVAHGLGVVHRDIKPENLFLEKVEGKDCLRVIDFGIAKGVGGNRTTQRGTLGTCAYMSPEQVEDAADVDARTDLFALGAVLWEMLVGRPAFEGKTAFASMQAVLDADPGAPSKQVPGLPGWLDDVVRRALDKERSGRFPSASAFQEALEQKQVAVVERKAAPPPSKGRGIGVWLALVAALLVGLPTVVLGGLAVLYLLFRPPEVHELEVETALCGETVITVDARSRTEPVVLTVDGVEVLSEAIGGRGTVTHRMTLTPGQQATIEASAGSARETAVHRAPGVATALVIDAPKGAREGAVRNLKVEVVGSCVPDGLRLQGTAAGRPVDLPVTSNVPVSVDVQGATAGRHGIELEVKKGDELVTRSSATLFVGERPPPNDQDMDGHERPADCNDQDPTVNPGQPESSEPNGVDDDCDGKIDEGTVAYDDDGDGMSELQGDCNDADRAIRPGRKELADCRDQDCDGEVDEGVTLPQKDDVYEPNDSKNDPHDLVTQSVRAFTKDLRVVFRDEDDEAWFRFHSDDGGWDDWGIDVSGTELPADSVIALEVYDFGGTSRGLLLAEEEGRELQVRGRAFRDDSGVYLLRVRPVKLLKPWCPAVLKLESR